MVKKKVSGQTIAIIILTVCLLLTIGFGGVFAYYTARSNKISGEIVMANLKISLNGASGESGKSEIVITNKTDLLPTQSLGNSPLTVQNLSSVPIYLVLVYKFDATKEGDDGERIVVDDNHTTPVFDLDMEYVNSINPNYSSNLGVSVTSWVDFVFEADIDDPQAKWAHVEGQQPCKAYRCLVSMVSVLTNVVVIDQDQLALAGEMGNQYQSSTISFTFQAYAIGAETDFGLLDGDTTADKCQKIVSVMYEAQGRRFLDI